MVYIVKWNLFMNEIFFADRLRSLRNERGISAREMSLALGQNETYINKLETNQRSISMPMFFTLCDFLNITPSEFFNAEIQNTTTDFDFLVQKFKKLSHEQAVHITFLIDELAKISVFPENGVS